jgi:UDP-glucose 4-epimerase
MFLVSGATGTIGFSLCKLLVSQGRRVVTIGKSRPLMKGIEEHIFYDAESDSRPPQLPDGVEYVAHFAQSRKYKEGGDDALRSIFRVNTNFTLQLLEAGRKSQIKAFFLASTGGLYTDTTGPLLESSHISTRNSPYLLSKLAAESLSSAYQEYFHVVIGRFFFVFGPEQKPPGLVAGLRDKIFAGQTIHVDKGSPKIPLLHSDDAARAVESLLVKDFRGIINIAGTNPLSIEQIVETLAQGMGRDFEITSPTRVDVPSVECDISTLLQTSNLIPNSPISGLLQFAAQPLYKAKAKNYEREKK